MVDDELAKKWGAWGGDRKLSPHFPTLAEIEHTNRNVYIALAALSIGAVVAVLVLA